MTSVLPGSAGADRSTRGLHDSSGAGGREPAGPRPPGRRRGGSRRQEGPRGTRGRCPAEGGGSHGPVMHGATRAASSAKGADLFRPGRWAATEPFRRGRPSCLGKHADPSASLDPRFLHGRHHENARDPRAPLPALPPSSSSRPAAAVGAVRRPRHRRAHMPAPTRAPLGRRDAAGPHRRAVGLSGRRRHSAPVPQDQRQAPATAHSCRTANKPCHSGSSRARLEARRQEQMT
jgi:hypothetical protein